MTLADYLAGWLEQQRSQLQPSTWESYRSNVERYLVPALGDVALGELSAAQLSAFYAKLQRDGGQRSEQPLALRTVQFCHGVLHKALADAVRFELVDRNVAVHADLPRVDLRGDGVRELRAWTAEQLRAFLDHTAGTPLHDLWHVAAATGMRRGELLGLRWDEVDLAGRALSVRRALSVVKGEARLKEPKTSRCRTLRLDVVTAGVLERRWLDQQRRQAGATAWHNPWNLVFTDAAGHHLDPMRITHAFRVAVRDAPVPRIRLHDYPDLRVIPTLVCEPLPCRVMGLLMSA
jgi:integrase